jgi:Na+/H+ antiporter NhaC
MGILCPVAVTVSIGLVGDLPADQAASLFYASVGSVLAGAVFGDHCSPISDTSVISSMAAASDHIDHIRTQLPYALLAGVVAFGMYLVAGLVL